MGYFLGLQGSPWDSIQKSSKARFHFRDPVTIEGRPRLTPYGHISHPKESYNAVN